MSGIVCRGFDYTHSEILFRPHVCVGACGTTDGAKHPESSLQEPDALPPVELNPAPQSGAVTPDDWQILLVNRWNPLPDGYTFERTKLKYGHSVDSRAYPDLQEMMDDCRAAGLDPVICSSYRTQAKRQELYENKLQRLIEEGYSYENAVTEAGTVVAKPGTSEHQTGLALDIVDASYQILDQGRRTPWSSSG